MHIHFFHKELILSIDSVDLAFSLVELAKFLLFLEVLVVDDVMEVVLFGNACVDIEDENPSFMEPSVLKYV